MPNKIEIIVNADGTRAIKVLTDVGATARATGNASVEASKAVAMASKFEGDTITQDSVRMVQARVAARQGAQDYARVQELVRRGAIDESAAITVQAAAYQRLEEARRRVTALQPAETRTPQAYFRERLQGGLGISESMGGETAVLVAAGVVATEAANKLREVVGAALELGEEMQRMSQKTGLAVETLSTIKYAAETTGGDFDSMTNAVSKMNATIGQATEGNKKAATFLHSLGFTDLKALADSADGTEQVFERLGKTIAATGTASRQTELLKGLMGKSGADQIPLLIELGAHWNDFQQQAQAAGKVMSGETAEAMARANERLKQMKGLASGAGLAFTEGLLPGLDQLLDLLGGSQRALEGFRIAGLGVTGMFEGIAAAVKEAVSQLLILSAIGQGGPLTESGRALLGKAKTLDSGASDLISAAMNGGKTPKQQMDELAAQMQNSFLGPAKPKTDGGFGGIGNIGDNPDEKRFHAMKASLDQKKLLYGDSNALEESYWKVMLSTAKAGTDLYKKVMEEYVKAQLAGVEASKRLGAQAHEDLQRTYDDLNKADAEQAKRDDAANRDTLKRASAAGMAGLEGLDRQQLEQLKGTDQVRELMLKFAPAGDAARQTAAMHGREYDLASANRKKEYDAQTYDIDEQRTQVNSSDTLTKDEKKDQGAALDEKLANLKRAYDEQTAEMQRAYTLQQAEDEQRIQSTTLMGGMNDALREFMRTTTDAGAVMKSVFTGALGDTNNAILKYLTEPASQTHGQHVFGQAGHEIFSSAAGGLLKYGEGSLMKGLVGKADGSESSPFFVRLAGMGKGGGAGAAADVKSGASDIGSFMSKLFGSGRTAGAPGSAVAQGGTLFGGSGNELSGLLTGGAGGDDGSAGSATTPGGSGSGTGSMFATLAKTLLTVLPMFAGGVDDFGGGMALVGEQGPELVNLPHGSSVTPNRKAFAGGGDTHHHYHISQTVDARGSMSPAEVEAAARRGGRQGAMELAPHIVAAGMRAQKDHASRQPSSKR